LGARLLLGLLWLVHWLPLRVQAVLGQGLGRVLFHLAASRRRVALRNLELCFPELTESARRALVREHFGWLARSLLERGLLWFAPIERVKALIHVEGDPGLADRSDRPVMWLAPHFVGLEQAGAGVMLFQGKRGVNVFQTQRNPVFHEAVIAGRRRFGNAKMYARSDSALPVVRAIKRGLCFFNACDQDFGIKDSGFVPFFGVPAATLLAPARMVRSLNMIVQPVVVEVLPGGGGYRLRFLPAWEDWPGTSSDEDAAARMNRWIEEEVRRNPAQYLWVHRRFKTRPPGEASLY
jgi:Kdo2-lipid IVA lauroyltransferase/acyltransferase